MQSDLDAFLNCLCTPAVVCFDFDLTLTGRHSIDGDQPRDMTPSMHVPDLRRLLQLLADLGTEMWVTSFADVRTVRTTLSSSGLAEFFVGDAPPDLCGCARMVDDGGRYWRVLTPSVCLGQRDRHTPIGHLSAHKVTMLDFARDVHAAMHRDADCPLPINAVLLIDDNADNARVCAEHGFTSLEVSRYYQLAGSLGTCTDEPADARTALAQLFSPVERVAGRHYRLRVAPLPM